MYPDEAELQVHMVIEQILCADKRISLASDKPDMFGQPLAQIEWSVGGEDVDNGVRATDAFRTMWNSSRLALFARFAQRPQVGFARKLPGRVGLADPFK